MIRKTVARVLRGGSWNNNGRNCRSAIRNNDTASKRNSNNGFRFVLAQYLIGRQVNDQILIQLYSLRINKKQGCPQASKDHERLWVNRLHQLLCPN